MKTLAEEQEAIVEVKEDHCVTCGKPKNDGAEEKKYTQWDMDNEYARGFNDGAYEQNKLNKNV